MTKQSRGKAFLIVGHKNWGKSSTLIAMTGGNYHIRYITIGNEKFFVRKMSNDDWPIKYLTFMKGLKPAKVPWLIAAFCPTFEQTDALGAEAILTILKRQYDLFFFVLANSYKDERKIKPEEIDQMQAHGDVLIMKGKDEKVKRAQRFQQYIEENI